MTWEESYREHELWTTVDEALTALVEIADEGIDDDALQLRAMLTQIAGHSDSPHPALTSPHLTSVNKCLESILSAIPDNLPSVFVKRPNQNQPSLFTQLAQYVRSWPATGSTSIRGLNSQVTQIVGSLASLNEVINERLTELTAEVEQIKATATASLEQHQSDLSEKRAEHATTLEEMSTELKTKFEELDEALDEADGTIEQQKTRLDSALTSHQEAFMKLQEELSQEWKERLSSSDGQLQAHVAAMEQYEEESRQVLSAVGVNATATDYGRYANEQSLAANRWRIGAVVALSIAAVAFLAAASLSFFGIGTNLDWWQVVVQKVGAPAGAAALGYLLLQESGQHRKEERAARQVQLTLTALEPFIANLPAKQQELIRVETAQSIFAPQRGGDKKTVPGAREYATSSQ
ncbi:coiled-coil domain-containing protein [Brevibacterium yomogidense]|uniref:hypothetical protein n=1 Tax=Brevibacterium yomogidense TaxID=946573 RepID=UPI0018DEF5C7|nr:hypothetical protein [Brevibacterium yomogidense]